MEKMWRDSYSLRLLGERQEISTNWGAHDSKNLFISYVPENENKTIFKYFQICWDCYTKFLDNELSPNK